MPEKILQTLDGVSETLLMTLYVRARESQRSDGMIKDDKAVAMVNRLECDFSRLKMQRHDEIAVIMRMKKFDGSVCDFLAQNPGAVVVHIGRAKVFQLLQHHAGYGHQSPTGDSMKDCPCEITHDEPSIVGGMYRVVMLRKTKTVSKR